MNAVIIDHEMESLTLLQKLIEHSEYLKITGVFTDTQEAYDGILADRPDVIFTEVEMSGMTGLELARKIAGLDSDIQIVFVTVCEDYALHAFEVGALNYILKPMTQEALYLTVTRLMKRCNIREQDFPFHRSAGKISIFGGFHICQNSENIMVKWPTAKTKELFAYFLCQREKPLEKWHLCDILWHASPPKKAEHNLHSTISRMKSALSRAGIEYRLTCSRGNYTMELVNLSCDLWEWMDFVENNPQITKENIDRYEQIIGMYSGDLFGNEDYLWTSDRKRRLFVDIGYEAEAE